MRKVITGLAIAGITARLIRDNNTRNTWYKNYKPFFDNLNSSLDTIIDVGAGDGIYGKYLKKYANKLIAIEKFKPFVFLLKLNPNYSYIFEDDVLKYDFDKHDKNTTGIFASHFIEHLPKSKGIEFLNRIKDFKFILLAFPVNPFNVFSRLGGFLCGLEPHQSSYSYDEMLNLGYECYITNNLMTYLCYKQRR